MLTCEDCKGDIVGDHTVEDGKPIHLRCLRKRIESRPGFIKWTKHPLELNPNLTEVSQ